MQQLSGVTAIEITEHSEFGPRIILFVQARYTHEGTTYDLGDWALLTDARKKLCAYELRSGVLEEGLRRPPVYRNGLQFCFGKSEGRIKQLFENGQLVEGFSVAVASIQHINEGHRAWIPETFRVAKSS